VTDVIDNRSVCLCTEKCDLILVSGTRHHILIIKRCTDICNSAFERRGHESLLFLNVSCLPNLNKPVAATGIDKVAILIERDACRLFLMSTDSIGDTEWTLIFYKKLDLRLCFQRQSS
jgi:hypothetical protein